MDKNYEDILQVEVARYKEAFNILMEYWDSLPDEEKPEIDKRLKNLGV